VIDRLILPRVDPFGITRTVAIHGRSWGYDHKSVNHGRGEFARDEDGDGLCEVHVNTMEGFWSLLRSWLRPHRGISQEQLPLYLSFFEFVHNMRKRGKALLGALIELLVS
jgi:transposase